MCRCVANLRGVYIQNFSTNQLVKGFFKIAPHLPTIKHPGVYIFETQCINLYRVHKFAVKGCL